MRKDASGQAGFTLLEVLICLTITAVLLAAMIPLFATSLALWRISGSRSEVQQTARFAVDSMVRDLKYGSDIRKVDDNELSFIDVQGRRSGYRLSTSSHILYNLLSNDTPQPVTGANIQKAVNVLVYGDYGSAKALFHVQEQTVYLYLTAVDTVTGQSFTVHTAVGRIASYLR